ncbi:ABC transporter permease subunit [Auraticoccus sp. F435]|uniref:ABC transporter permease subunit n=1 Tax=Auraticoccus cholistanensis TaxID=2656650 RepID=A0A6A9UXQ6_9ACTN|nr:ABC transporter permease subunit [Auraticoccus cholistanensis]
MQFARYLLRRTLWLLVTFVAAMVLVFLLIRLVPGNPVDAIVAQMTRGGGGSGEQVRAIYDNYMREFGLDLPLWQQFLVFCQNVLQGDFGTSFAQYPAPVTAMIGQALPWSIAIQLPAIVVGWLVGNVVGAVAAFRGGWFDKGAFLTSIFATSVPYYCLAIILLFVVAVRMQILPAGGGYSFGLSPELTLTFFGDAITYFWLPFWSLVIVFIGGQAVGMRSMAIYELGSDYVNYARGLGIGDNRITRYIFRNAMLPQLSGLALSIGGMIGGALITELVFNYPGLGTLLFTAISSNDYPVIQAIVLLITIAVLLANFLVDVVNGLIDPRIRAAETGDR